MKTLALADEANIVGGGNSVTSRVEIKSWTDGFSLLLAYIEVGRESLVALWFEILS